MPVFVVENREHGNVAYCNSFEGASPKRLNYGVYDDEVRVSLDFLRDVAAPVLRATLHRCDGGVPLQLVRQEAPRRRPGEGRAGGMLGDRAPPGGGPELAVIRQRRRPGRGTGQRRRRHGGKALVPPAEVGGLDVGAVGGGDGQGDLVVAPEPFAPAGAAQIGDPQPERRNHHRFQLRFPQRDRGQTGDRGLPKAQGASLA